MSGTNIYLSNVHYDASGQVTDQLLGDNLLKQACYDSNTLRLAKLWAYPGTTLQSCDANPPAPLLALSFSYQANGNISKVTDAGVITNFSYDELDRLSTASGPYNETYTYTSDNNLKTRTALGTTRTYTYNSTNKHAVTNLSSGESYSYGANRNMYQRVEGGLTYTQAFDAENRLISITVNGQTTQFAYDGDGNMVKKVAPDGSRTIYIGGIYEVKKNASGTVTGTTTYYPAAGAMRVGGTVYYILGEP